MLKRKSAGTIVPILALSRAGSSSPVIEAGHDLSMEQRGEG